MIAIISVMYNPLRRNIDTFIQLSSFYDTYIFNNGMEVANLNLLKSNDRVRVIGDGFNIGLASAFNMAINEAFHNSSIDSVVIFDQDSSPDQNLPIMLKSSFKNASKFTNIGVICPVYVDDTSDNYYSKYSQDDALISVQTVASSGSYIEREIWRDVGAFDDKLFIDGIDHEWCFRLQSRGYRCFVDRRIQMKHRMGEYSITFFGTAKPVHRDPIRHYFIIRNTLYLTSKAYIPNSWKFLELLKSIRRIVFYILASRNRSLTIKYMFQAVFDAAKQKMGPLK